MQLKFREHIEGLNLRGISQNCTRDQ